MLSLTGLIFFLSLFAVAIPLQALADKLKLPYAVLLVILGFVASELTTRLLDIDTGVRWDNLKPLFTTLFIPLIIFSAALRIDLQALWQNRFWVFMLALPLTLLAILLVAVLLYFGVGHPSSFPWEGALLTAVLISATDPSSLPKLFRQLGVSNKLVVLLEGESLFNDALAVVLFSLMLALLSHEVAQINYHAALYDFLRVFFAGIGVGILFGAIIILVLKSVSNDYIKALSTVSVSYGVYFVADEYFHASGVMAALTTALMISYFCRAVMRPGAVVDKVWAYAGKTTHILIFLLAGITITMDMFSDRWLAMLLGITAVLLVRTGIIFILLPVFSLLPKLEKFTLAEKSLLVWGGMRGAVTLILVLSLPIDTPAWYTVQSIAYGVVLFNLFVQMTSIPMMVNRLFLTRK